MDKSIIGVGSKLFIATSRETTKKATHFWGVGEAVIIRQVYKQDAYIVSDGLGRQQLVSATDLRNH